MIGYWYWLRFLWRKHVASGSVADPFTVFRAPSCRIECRDRADIDKWRHMGAVWDGEWDRQAEPIIESIKFRGVYEHFAKGTSWEETDLYRKAVEEIRAGRPYWNRCRSLDDLHARTAEVDGLCRRIQDEGLKSQSEIHGKDIDRLLLSPFFDRSKTDITVSIARGGELQFGDGHHRLAIAKALGLEHVPVRVVVRHSEWQAIREKVAGASARAELDEEIRAHLDHPDIASLVGFHR